LTRFAIVAALSLLAGACVGGSDPAAAPTPAGEPATAVTVDSTDKLTYEPARVLLKAGGTVTWTNTGRVPHTVTFSGFDKPLKAGDEVTFTFTTSGTTKVRCTLHPRMTGEIVVV